MPKNDELVELITALGVFDPNLVFASAVDTDFQNQWVCNLMHNEDFETTLTLTSGLAMAMIQLWAAWIPSKHPKATTVSRD